MNDLLKYHGKFSSISAKLHERPIIGFDTEDDTKGTPLSFAFYSDAGSFYTTDVNEAIDFIYNISEPSYFVAHNLEYDIGNLFKQCEYKYIEEMIYASQLLKVTLMCTKHVFINSSSFFKGKLSDMGEFINLPKLEGDVLDKEYNIRDAEIVYQFMKQFQHKLVNELQINLGVTIGQLAMAAYRTNYMQSKSQKTYSSPNCLKAYYGGRVEIFYKGAIKNIKMSDINSCYPYVMKAYDYPDTSYIEPSRLDTHEHGIGKFRVRVPSDMFLPPLPYRVKTGRLFFPTGDFTGWWTYPEMRYAVKYGVKILKEYEGEGTNDSCNPFVTFVDDFYGRRLKAKKAKNAFEILLYKLIPNNLYGKWCQHKPNSQMSKDVIPLSKLERMGTVLSECKLGPFHNYVIDKKEIPKTANYMWGIYVTAYARMYLHDAMDKIYRAGGTVIYCDTDSIMFSGCKNPLPLSDKLGDWDNEKFNLGVFRQAKGYLLCNKKGEKYEIKKVACKGVPTDYAYDFIIEGRAEGFKKPMRLKESLIRINAVANEKATPEFIKELGVNYWNEVSKEMRSIYIKRLGDKGITYPVNAKDIESLENKAAKNEQLSIEKELKQYDIQIKKSKHKDYFRNIVIPPGWFKRTRMAEFNNRHSVSGKVRYFKKEECLSLLPGSIWFAGTVFATEKDRYGHYYKISCDYYKGEKAPPNFTGGFRAGFLEDFGVEENITGKYLDIKLAKKYTIKSSLQLDITISDLNNSGQFEDEISEPEEISNSELEKLKAADWSSIDAIFK